MLRFSLSFALICMLLPGSEVKSGVISEEPKIVLVELFTSEGCSSCPAADRLLPRLQAEVGPKIKIIPLSEHVDYWNQLGWHDPFSKSQFSARQNQYARRFGQTGVYTPQLIFNGKFECVGSDLIRAKAAIEQASQETEIPLRMSYTYTEDRANIVVTVKIDSQSAFKIVNSTELWLTVTEDGITVPILRGENAGLKLSHTAVARALRKIDTDIVTEPGSYAITFTRSPSWKPENLRAVAFLQDGKSLAILGSATIKLACGSLEKKPIIKTRSNVVPSAVPQLVRR